MTSQELKTIFFQLVQEFTNQSGLIEECWREIEMSYGEKGRHYHTLNHLQNLVVELTPCRQQIGAWDVILFSVYYHDVIYKALKNTNEEKSAELAETRMLSLQVPAEKIAKTKMQILATKGHHISNDTDTNIFTDADLSILGKPWDEYALYYQQIRKEYSVYPDLIYYPGRRKVLRHFLAMERIYKTDFFFQQYEAQARTNLEKELRELY